MAEGCGYKNSSGVQCGLSPHPSSVSHELYQQLVAPDPFCLQPWDPIALSTIRAWIAAATAYKVNPAKIQRAEEHFNQIRRWQKENGTKTPD